MHNNNLGQLLFFPTGPTLRSVFYAEEVTLANNIYYNYYNLSLLLLQKVIGLIAYQETTVWKIKKNTRKVSMFTFNPPSDGPCFSACFSASSLLFCCLLSLSGSLTPRLSA